MFLVQHRVVESPHVNEYRTSLVLPTDEFQFRPLAFINSLLNCELPDIVFSGSRSEANEDFDYLHSI